jgi:hypothetical protein
MKNSTTTLLLLTFTLLLNLFFNTPVDFLAICIYSSTALILMQLEGKDKK